MASQVEKALAAAQGKVPPGTLRHEVLSAARRFKSGWTDLAALLVRVQRLESYKEWGFKSFEGYCAKELHLRKQTALKLTQSYGFLDRHDRALLSRPPEERPAFEVVEVLAKAEERGQLSEREYEGLREQIWSDGRLPRTLARELSQKFPAPPPPPLSPEVQLLRLAATARRLAQELAANGQVPHAVRARAEALAEELESLGPS